MDDTGAATSTSRPGEGQASVCRRTGSPAGGVRVLVAIACLGQFMVVLDASVVNVALPAIRDGLGFSPSGLPWVVTGYALTFAGLLVLGGRLADVVGRRRAFVGGLALFTVASLVGGLAPVPGVLVGARLAQGAGAAVLTPATLATITTVLPEGPARTRALAAWTAVASAGGAAGNLAGGALTDLLSWRATLLVNVPMGLALAVAAARRLPSPTSSRTRLDVGGAVAATTGLVALNGGVTLARELGWTAPATVGALVVGATSLGVLVLVERRAEDPLLPPRMWRLSTVARGNAVMLLAGCALMPMWYFLSLAMQEVLGLSAWQTALGFLPHTLLGVLFGAWVAPRAMRVVSGRTLIVVGALVAAVGFWLQSRLAPGDAWVGGILVPAIVLSVGGGLLTTPLTEVVLAGVADDDAGAASGLMNTTKQVGGGLGLSLLALLVAGDAAGAAARAVGYDRAFLAMAAVLVATALVAMTLPRRPPDDGRDRRRTTSATRPTADDVAVPR